jgi:hypothetical protein
MPFCTLHSYTMGSAAGKLTLAELHLQLRERLALRCLAVRVVDLAEGQLPFV